MAVKKNIYEYYYSYWNVYKYKWFIRSKKLFTFFLNVNKYFKIC